MIHVASILFSLFIFHSTNCTEWTFHSAAQAALLSDEIQEPFILSNLSYQSDVTLSRQEFDYLVGLKVGQKVSGASLQNAIVYLFQKGIYETVTVTLHDRADGKTVHFDLKGFWRFESIKLSGIWVGKEWYKQFYLMEPGDHFDAEKHAHSVKKMKDACKRDGYFNVRAQSRFNRDSKRKSIAVHTAINRGARFVIRNIRVHLKAEDVLNVSERSILQRQIEKRLSRALLHGKYAKSTLVAQTKELKKFLAHKGFIHVSMNLKEHVYRSQRAVHLEWNIDISKKREFVFFGNHFFSSKQLLEKILQFGRSSFIVPASILEHEIKQAYQKKGFWQVEIDAKDERDRSFFIIKEGPRAVINTVTLHGVEQLSHRLLLRRCFSKIKRHGVFDAALLDDALDRLKAIYLKKGFLESEITHHDCQPESNGTDHTLSVTIYEGSQTTIGSISIPGFEYFEKEEPFRIYRRSSKPVAYDEAMIQQQKRFLSEQLRKEGYLFPTIHHELKPYENTYQLCWYVEPGNQIAFGKTIVQAQTTIPFCRIVRELTYQEGQQWDPQKIKASFARLKSLNLYDSISFTPLVVKEGDTKRDVLLKIRQDDPFELRVRTGLEFQYIRKYQTFGGMAYRVGGTFMVKNPTNHADVFRFDADVARSHREVHMKYLYPWIANAPCDGIVDAYANKYEQPGFIGSKRNLYTLYQNGFLCGIHSKSEHVDTGINIGFEVARTAFSADDLKTKQAAVRLAQAINFDICLLDRRVAYLFFEPTIMIDFLDDNIYPTRGMFTLCSLKGMFPTSNQFLNAGFLKFLLEHSWFVPLKKWVAAFRVRCGHIFHKCFSEIMPNERFYLGGSHSIRSYETDLAPPTSVFVDDDDKCHIVPRGGKTMINVNAELRIPVAKKAGLVVFQDMGILAGDSWADFKPDHVIAGTGFGLRFFTPIGPLRFDIGWKWKTERPEERKFNWVLTFGNAF